MLSTRQIWDRYGCIYINPTKAGHWNVEARRNNHPQNRSYANRDPHKRIWKCETIEQITQAVEEARKWIGQDWING